MLDTGRDLTNSAYDVTHIVHRSLIYTDIIRAAAAAAAGAVQYTIAVPRIAASQMLGRWLH